METEARLTDMEKQLEALRTHIDDSVVKIEQSRVHNLQQIESETTKLNLIADQASARVQDLYGKTETHLTALMGRVAKLEEDGGSVPREGNNPKHLVQARHMLPSKLSKAEGWRRWRLDVEDFAEASVPGLKSALRTVAKTSDGDYSAEWLDLNVQTTPNLVVYKDEIWRMLKNFTEQGGEARRVTESTHDDNCWWAWKALHNHYEPSLAVREGQVLAEMTNMVKHVARNPAKTKRMVLELEDKIRKVTEVTGDRPSDQHTRSFLAGFIDKETSMHCGVQLSSSVSDEDLKIRVLQFVNAMMARTNSDKMDVSKLSMAEASNSDAVPREGEARGGAAGRDQGELLQQPHHQSPVRRRGYHRRVPLGKGV